MLQRQFPMPVKFICGLIYSNETLYENVKSILIKKFGKIDSETQKINFDFTNYYNEEMGTPLFRRFISFEKLKCPSEFVNIKLYCLKIERKYSKENKRTVNIDPGYINEAKLVLTTTKDFSHRIYIGKGIFAEVTLQYKEKKYCDLPTTFPDYRTLEYKNIFLTIRDIYRRQTIKPHGHPENPRTTQPLT